MRNELQQLHTYRQQSELVFRSLTAEDKSTDVLQRLRSGEALESIAIRLTTGSVQPDRNLEITPAYQTFDPFQAVFGHAADIAMMDSSGPSANISNALMSGLDSGGDSSMHHSMGEETGFEWEVPQESLESSSVSRARSSVDWSPDHISLPQADDQTQWPIIGRWGPQSENGPSPGDLQRDKGQEFLLGGSDTQQSFNTASWTDITDDTGLMDHLLALYFCWE